MSGAPLLIVDDDQNILILITEYLESEGFTTIQATNGIEGLRQLEIHNPRLVILDVNMPELDGMQTCRMIRANEKFQNLPVLMLTARSDIQDMIQARRMGATDYLTKPFAPQALIQKVVRLLGQ